MGVTPQQGVYTHTCTLQRVYIQAYFHILEETNYTYSFSQKTLLPLTERIPTAVLQLCYKTKLYECELLQNIDLHTDHTPYPMHLQ